MGKYLVLWEVDRSRVPVDAKERGATWGLMVDMVKKDMQAGVSKDWGSFVGELRGYAVAEGTELEVGNMLMQYTPYVTFEVHPIASVAQVGDIIKKMSG
jgi:hypothetical protein